MTSSLIDFLSIMHSLINRKSVKEEVNRFRSEYQRVKYSYDEPLPKQLKVLEGKRLDN